jgi:multiple sugar transport system permease protein
VPLLVYQQAFGLNQMGAASTSAVGMMVVMAVFMALYLYRAQRVRGHDASR